MYKCVRVKKGLRRVKTAYSVLSDFGRITRSGQLIVVGGTTQKVGYPNFG